MYRRAAVLTALAFLVIAAAPGATSAGTGVVVTVVNADGGIFWRTTSPDWNSPIRNVGYGVYNGDQVELECWTTGSTVPPYWNNAVWYDAVIVAGRGLGEGFVNDHFLDTGVNHAEPSSRWRTSVWRTTIARSRPQASAA